MQIRCQREFSSRDCIGNQRHYAVHHGPSSSKPDSRRIRWQRVSSGGEPLGLQQQPCLKTSPNPILPTTDFSLLPESPSPQTILLLGSPSHLAIVTKLPRPIPYRWLRSQARAWVYIYKAMRTGDMHKLSSGSAGTICSSPQLLHLPVSLQTTVAQHREGRKLCQVWLALLRSNWNATIFIAYNSLRANHTPLPKIRLFQHFDSGPHRKPSINNSLFYDIVIRIAAHYGLYDPPKLKFKSDFTCRGPYIAVAQICTCVERSLAMLGNLRELHESL